MKNFIFILFILSVLSTSCTSSQEEITITPPEERPLIVEKDGQFTEWYPGHEQIKTKGRLDEEGRRQGIWKHYSEQGVVLSITVYTAGKKDGHIVVRYPNDVVHYDGEYKMDERVGLWRFYDEAGELVKQEDYGYPEN